MNSSLLLSAPEHACIVFQHGTGVFINYTRGFQTWKVSSRDVAPRDDVILSEGVGGRRVGVFLSSSRGGDYEPQKRRWSF